MVCCRLIIKGHIEHLRNAKALGDTLIVGVLSKAAVMEKKVAPTMEFDERFDLIRNIRCVDVVVAQHTYSPLDTVMGIRPDILVESTDHEDQPANEFMRNIGGRVVALPYYLGHSSTQMKKNMAT